MKEVKILFANLQSHENTSFSLCPGMNFILANDNNVGKSTIFKVLTTIARAPNVSSAKLKTLIRKGCWQAYAAFMYDDEKVVAWFTLAEREVAKLFFEHTHGDGQVTRSLFCPKSLLDALGIVIGENEEVLNFNDADSVQLIARVSTEADAVITHVMLDSRVEAIKYNRVQLGREIASDAKMLSAQAETSESILKDMHYQPAVDEFKESKTLLESACRVCDGCLFPVTETRAFPSSAVLETCGHALEALESVRGYLDALPNLQEVKVISPALQSAVTLVKDLSAVNLSALQVKLPAPEQLLTLKNTASDCSALLQAMRAGEQLLILQKSLFKISQERQAILFKIRANTVEVDCPVKGKVYYSDEECLPYRD